MKDGVPADQSERQPGDIPWRHFRAAAVCGGEHDPGTQPLLRSRNAPLQALGDPDLNDGLTVDPKAPRFRAADMSREAVTSSPSSNARSNSSDFIDPHLLIPCAADRDLRRGYPAPWLAGRRARADQGGAARPNQEIRLYHNVTWP